MVLKSKEPQTMQSLIREAITELCRRHLKYKSNVCMEALVGITLDDTDVILVSINEKISVPTKSPKKKPMQVALKCVERAVQRVNARSSMRTSPRAKAVQNEVSGQMPAVINIVPTNLDVLEDPPALGTVEIPCGVGFPNPELNQVAVKEEKDDTGENYEASVPSAKQQLPEAKKPNEQDAKTGLVITRKRRLSSDDNHQPRKSSRVQCESQSSDGRPLNLIYLGINRDIVHSRDFKRGRFFEQLMEKSVSWDELDDSQRNCVYAKAALRGREENEILCSLCNFSFSKALDFKLHVQAHFSPKEPTNQQKPYTLTTDSQQFCCPLCNDIFSSKQSLTEHIRRDHQLFCQDLLNSSNKTVKSSGPGKNVKPETEAEKVETVKHTVCTTKSGRPVRAPTRADSPPHKTKAEAKPEARKTEKQPGKSIPAGDTEKAKSTLRTSARIQESQSKASASPVAKSKKKTMEVTVVPKLSK